MKLRSKYKKAEKRVGVWPAFQKLLCMLLSFARRNGALRRVQAVFQA